MKFGFSTYFFVKRDSLDVIAEGIDRGITIFELSQEIPHVLSMDDGFFDRIEGMRREGIEFSMHAPFFEINLGSFFEEIREISKAKIKRALDVAGRIGASPVVVHPGYTFYVDKVKQIEETTRDNFIEDLREVALYAEERGVKIGLENVHMPYFFFYELNDFTKIHDEAPGVGMTLDVGHAYITKCAGGIAGPEDAIISELKRIGVERLAHVHLHNNLGIKDDHTFLHGDIDLKKIVLGLHDLGYQGKIIIESYDMEEHGMAPVIDELQRIAP